MKKIMYAIGLITSISVSIGWLFKLLHLPGGGPLFNFGFLGFALIFIPMLTIDHYKENLRQAWSDKLRVVLGFSSAMITGVSVLFKLMHWPGADILLILGIFLFSFGFLPFLFSKMYQKSMK